MMRGVAAGERTRTGGRAVGAALLAVGLTAVLAVTGGCDSSEPEPTPSSIAPTTSSPTPTPTETPLVEPTMPPEMDRDDEVGAVAAAEYFMELYEWIYATGDLAIWDEISGQTCEFCSNAHSAVADAYVGGARIESGAADFSGFVIADFDEQLVVYTIEVDYSLPEATHIDDDGEELGTIPSESGVLLLEVAPSPRGWILMDGTATNEATP